MSGLVKQTDQYQLQATRLQEKLDDGSTRCHLCSWRCRLRHGQRGFCQAHVNRNGVLYNLSYGIISAMDIGAIEDKPVKHFQPGSKVMSIGSYGCSFRCGGCHNLDISWGVTALDELARGQSTDAYVSPEQMIEAALRHQVQGIAFTYSEPAVWLEYVLDVAKLAKDANLYTVYVSNSFVTREALTEIAPYVDVLCSDVKSLDQDFYTDICAKAKVEDILDAIAQANELGMHVETRTNIIPTRNDNIEMLRGIAQWIYDHLGADSPWHITKFFPAYKLAHLPPTPTETMQAAYTVAKEVGLKNVYVYDDKGCDCAMENLPVSQYLEADPDAVHQVKKCAASCCGDEGVLLKKYEANN
jgi:pyruvate formate lyase activating enzyme